ncbi:uncharacterized protein LOC144461912 [Epinephelus lanceolatus]
MKFGLSVAFLLLVFTGTVTVKGFDLSGDPKVNGPDHDEAVLGARRVVRGLTLFDLLTGKGASPQPNPAKPPAGYGVNPSDVPRPDPKLSKPVQGNDAVFNLADALHPAQKPTVPPTRGECQGFANQKLSAVLDNQNQQLRLLLQLVARSRPISSRFMR